MINTWRQRKTLFIKRERHKWYKPEAIIWKWSQSLGTLCLGILGPQDIHQPTHPWVEAGPLWPDCHVFPLLLNHIWRRQVSYHLRHPGVVESIDFICVLVSIIHFKELKEFEISCKILANTKDSKNAYLTSCRSPPLYSFIHSFLND